ncbi:MltA domain-containing protein [Colwelliaceae bacterium 6471]
MATTATQLSKGNPVFFRVFISCLFFSSSCLAYEFIVEDVNDFGQITDFQASELCLVAQDTTRYINTQPQDAFAVHAGKVFEPSVTLTRVQKTLAFICETYREDMRHHRESRLNDPQFLAKHFDFLRWLPDKERADAIAKTSTNDIKRRLLENIPNEQIFLTKYYTKLLSGSAVQTEKFSQALYALPDDERHMTAQEADKNKDKLTRFRYTRQQVISGVLLKNKLAKPLIWLTEEALHDVLLQGTGVLNIGGEIRYFNVHRNNGIAYNYSIGKNEQSRYWYFAQVPSIMGYGQKIEDKIAIKPQVTFAGNVAELGLGKLIMVNYQRNDQTISRLGILADQGGAFDGNLFQLDMLVDSYRGWSDFHQANKQLPDYAKAWIMLIKE